MVRTRWIAVLAVAMACGRARVPAPADVPVPGEGDPVVAKVDLGVLRWSQLSERLRELRGEDQAEVRALALAASDVLVVREMQVVGQAPAATETTAQAADRFLASVWNERRGCALTDDEIRLAYLQNLARYKHPPGWTVWQVQTRCCPEPPCALAEKEACLGAARPAVQALAGQLRKAFADLPAMGAAADATAVQLAHSPLRDRHVPAFEEVVAQAQAAGAKLQLLRYSFWQTGVAGFEKAPFRRADPAVERTAAQARLGDIVGPVDTEDEIAVFTVAARQPLALGLPRDASASVDPQVIEAQRELRLDLCRDVAKRERQEYREKLLAGAVLQWDEHALAGKVSAQAVGALQALSKR
ncbi:MAG: hypothetical protein FJ100_00195 [Deltaproteobacteria bacterium]|nr:hypothetical protein [Deltaproteobacteria bacterium]